MECLDWHTLGSRSRDLLRTDRQGGYRGWTVSPDQWRNRQGAGGGRDHRPRRHLPGERGPMIDLTERANQMGLKVRSAATLHQAIEVASGRLDSLCAYLRALTEGVN